MPQRLTIKNNIHEIRLFTQRILVIAVIIALLTLALIARLVYLQVVERSVYTTLSKENQLTLIPISPKRGLIYDRNGVLLARNITVSSLDIIPDKVKNFQETIKRINDYIPISKNNQQDFYKILRQKRHSQPIPLKLKLTEEEIALFSVNQWRFPGVTVNARLIRDYPLSDLLSHILGYVGRISADDLQDVDLANYSATDYIGKIGLEKYFEDQLHGTVGYQQAETDASGHIIRTVKVTPPISGKDLYLTIDSKLQTFAMKALENQRGAVVAIDPQTGQIIAMASNPSYNPNLFVQGISNDDYKELQNAADRPLYNRAIRGLYSPGSTIKPFMGLEGLDSAVITPSYKVFDQGSFKLKNARHIYHNYHHRALGWVNLERAITVSDDYFFYNLAVLLGINRMSSILDSFGFGQGSGIEIDEELPGVLPSPTWKVSHLGTHWYNGDTVNTGIGQGYLLATPLQLASATSILAEHGQHHQPHLLLKMQPQDDSAKPGTPIPPINLPDDAWKLITKSMQEVITSPEGTAHRFGPAPYSVAGKTGTAQVYSVKQGNKYNKDSIPEQLWDNSLFIAFAPVENPKIAIAVVVEHDHIALEIARKILDYYLLELQKHS